MIETLDDIVEELANKLMVYGLCPGFLEGEDVRLQTYHCRPCFVAYLTGRIRAAAEVERKLDA